MVDITVNSIKHMGCWNGTCGVSQLPILGGDKVKAFLLLQSKYQREVMGSGTSSSTSYFSPWFFPITAEYNDYGSIENITNDWNSKYMLEKFQEWLLSGEVKLLDRMECEVSSVDIEKFQTVNEIFDCVERGSLSVKNHHEKFDKSQNKWVPVGGYLKIGIFLVLEDVFDAMVNESEQFMRREDGDSEFHAEFYKTDREKAIEAIEKVRLNYGDEKTMDELAGCVYGYHVDRILGDVSERTNSFKHYKSILYNPKSISIDEFMSKLNESDSFSTAMSFLRKMWMPQTGQGSQSEELCFNKALINIMSEHIEKRNVQLEEYRREEEFLDETD